MKKMCFVALLLAGGVPFFAVAASLSVNFTTPGGTGALVQGSNYGLVPVTAANWNQVTTVSAAANDVADDVFPAAVALKDSSGALTAATVAADARTLETGLGTAYDPILRGYMLDYAGGTARSENGWPKVKLTGIPYSRYRVYVYMCNETWEKSGSVTITPEGGARSDFYYMDGASVKTAADNTGWGNRGINALKLGVNCLRTPVLSEPAITVGAYRSNSAYFRGTIAAIQVEEVRTETLTLTGNQTINAADYTPGVELTIDNAGSGNTLTVKGALSVGTLTFTGNPLNIRLAEPIAADTLLVQNSLTFTTFLKNSVLPQRLTLLDGTITLEGAGALNLPPPAGADSFTRDTAATTGLHAYAQRLLPQAGLGSVSVNFASNKASLEGQSGVVGAYPVDAARWMNTANPGNSGGTPTTTVFSALTNDLGTVLSASLQVCSNGGTYNNGSNATLIGKLMYGYLDDSHGSNFAGFQVTGVPYERYGVIIYFNTDSGNATPFPAYRVNGAYYRGTPALGTLTGTGAQNYWGAKSTTALTEGGNYLVVTGFSNTDNPNLLVSLPAGAVPWYAGYRACISGFQLVDMTSLFPPEHYTATVPGSAAMTEIEWDNGKNWSGGSLNATAAIDFTSAATLTLDGSVMLQQLALSSAGSLLIRNAAVPLAVASWDLGGVTALVIDGQSDTLFPAPMTSLPKKYLYTAPGGTVSIDAGKVYEFHAGTAESPAVYTPVYAGGELQITGGHYRMTAAPTPAKTTLKISGDPVIHFNNGSADTNFDVGSMDVTLSGGTIRAGKFITSQGGDNRPNTFTMTGGEIIVSGNGSAGATGTAPLMFGHWGAAATGKSVVNLSGGSIRADNGGFRLSNDSQVDFTMSGGYLRAKEIRGKGNNDTTFTLSGGELAIGSGGFDNLGRCTFTLAGGAVTALETNGIRMTVSTRAGTTSTVSAAAGQSTSLAVVQGGGNLVFGTETNTGAMSLTAPCPAFSGRLTLGGIAFKMGTFRMPAATLDPASAGAISLTLSNEDFTAVDPLAIIGWSGADLPENITFAVYEPDGATLRADCPVILDTARQCLAIALPGQTWTASSDLSGLNAYTNLTVGDGAAADGLIAFNQLIVPAAGGAIACSGDASIRPASLVQTGSLTLDATAFASKAAYAAPGLPYSACLLHTAIGDTSKVTIIPPELPVGYETATEVYADGAYLVITSPVYTTPCISLNFIAADGVDGPKAGYGQLQSPTIHYGAYPVPGADWHEIDAVANSANTTTNIGQISVSQWGQRGYYGCSTVPLDFLKGYIDDGTDYARPSLTIRGLEAAFGEGAKYRVVFYASTDTAGGQFGYATIGGVNYSAKHGHTVKALAEKWGDSRSTTPVEGDFHVISDVLTGDELILSGNRLSGSVRGTIAAIQIVQVTDTLRQVPLYQPTALATGDWTDSAWVDASNGDAPYGGSWNEPAAMALIDATNAGAVTLTVNQAVALAKLTVKGGGDLTIALGPGGSFTAAEYDFSQHTGTLAVGFATGVANVTSGARTALVSGSGILTIDPGKVATLPALGAWSGIVINNGIIRYRGALTASAVPAQVGVVAFDDLTYTGNAGFSVPTFKMEPGDRLLMNNTENPANAHRFASNALITGGTLTIGSAASRQAAYWNGNTTITQTGGDIVYESDGIQDGVTQAKGFLFGANAGSTAWIASGGSIHAPKAPLNFWSLPGSLTLSGGAQAAFAGIIRGSGNGSSTVIVKDGASLTLGATGVPAATGLATFTVTNATLNASATTAFENTLTLGGEVSLGVAPGETLTLGGALSGTGVVSLKSGTLAVQANTSSGFIVENGAALRIEGLMGGAKNRHIRLRVTDWPKTNPNGNLSLVASGVAIGEFRLLSGGRPLAWGQATLAANPEHGNGAAANEGSGKMFDGAFNTKAYMSAVAAQYVFTFDRKDGAPVFDAYQIFATDVNGRNPIAWVLEGSDNGTTWVELDRRTLTLDEAAAWSWTGATANEPGPSQGKTFTLASGRARDLTVRSGAALGGTGLVSGKLVLEDGALLRKTNPDPEAALTLSTPAQLGGSVRVQWSGFPLQKNVKNYILKGPGTQSLDLSKIVPPPAARIGLDETGLFLQTRVGLTILFF